MKIASILLWLVATSLVSLATDKKPLTNADVVKMVKAELPEATILLAIQANPREFDPSVDALIELKTSGVPSKVIEAMLQPAPATQPVAQASPPSLNDANGTSASEQKSRPYAFALDSSGERKRLQSTPFKIIATKAKGNSVAMLLAESAVTDVAGDIVMNGAANVLLATAGNFGGTIATAAFGLTSTIGQKIFKSDEATLTYVCALGARQSANNVSGSGAQFELYFADVFGADPDEFEPAIVKTNPTPKNWRLVAAIKAKKSEFDDGQQARPLEIIEERVPVNVKKLGRGHAEVAAATPLAPGEYAIVLRPVEKTKKVVLREIEQEQGEGIVLRPVWDFSISQPPAEAGEQKSKPLQPEADVVRASG
jgi:hypothetical protein